MKLRYKAILIISVLCLSIGAIPVTAQAVIATKPAAAIGTSDIGIIFNTSNILFGLDSYQAGIGAKWGWGSLALRTGLDLGLNGTTQTYYATVGLALENHFMTGAISPYYGAFAEVGYNTQPEVITMIPFAVGGIVGVEIYILDFLSVFAEYAISADFAYTMNLGTALNTFDYSVDAKMGNDSMIGVIVYFQREKEKK